MIGTISNRESLPQEVPVDIRARGSEEVGDAEVLLRGLREAAERTAALQRAHEQQGSQGDGGVLRRLGSQLIRSSLAVVGPVSHVTK